MTQVTPFSSHFRLNENALHYAARSGRADIVQLLLLRGVDSSLRGECGLPLDVAEGSKVKEILERHTKGLNEPSLFVNDPPIKRPPPEFSTIQSVSESSEKPQETTFYEIEEGGREKEREKESEREKDRERERDRERENSKGAIYKYALHRACQRGDLVAANELMKRRVMSSTGVILTPRYP